MATARLIRAIRANESLPIHYHAGSSPGERRRITPILVFTAEGFPATYVSAWCHQREAERTSAPTASSFAETKTGL